MGSLSEIRLHYQTKLYQSYLFLSLIASAVLWVHFWYMNGGHFYNAIWPSAFVMIHLTLYYSKDIFFYYFNQYSIGLFLGQMIFLSFIGSYQKMFSIHFLTLIPFAVGLHYQALFSMRNERDKNILFYSLVTGGWAFLSLAQQWGYSHDKGIFLAFLLWAGGFVFILAKTGPEYPTLIIDLFQDQGRKESLKIIDYIKQERLFFHDIINQTHGLALYLENKMSSHQNMNPSECQSYLNEIRYLQSMIQDHFGLKHKNLSGLYEYVDFDTAKESFELLIHTYLISTGIDVTTSYAGLIAQHSVFKEGQLVHLPTFQRVLSNIVKNIKEGQSSDVSFNFDYTQKGLIIFVKNRYSRLADETDENLAKRLTGQIKNFHDLDQMGPLGLDSIEHLINKIGGGVHFETQGDYWLTRIFLPRPLEYDGADIKKAS